MRSLWSEMKRMATAGVVLLAAAQGAQAAGLMTPTSTGLPELEIRQHHVDVVLQDGYAVTTIEQVFYNPHSEVLEARYSFPVPEQAAVGEFTYWIDDKPVTGEVLEKQHAREVYQQEKAQGRETALTEQDQYRSFDSSVYPVQPDSDVRIRLVYVQPVHVDLGIGRYVYPLEEGGVDEEKLAFWTYNDRVTGSFSFNLRVRSSYPVDSVRMPDYPQASVQQHAAGEWQVTLGGSGLSEEGESGDPGNPATIQRLDRDIVVYWRLQQGLPGGIDVVTYRGEDTDRGTFMMTVTPGDDLGVISGGRDWVFVLDYSGSMQGKYHSLIEGVRKGMARLNTGDRFRVVLFNNRSWELTNGYTAVSAENIKDIVQRLESTRPDGGTNLYAGLDLGIRGLDADRPSAVLLVTDGVANVGVTQKKDFLDLLERHDVRLFSFVMGNSANRPLLEGMTKVSNGFAMNVSNSDDIVGRIVQTTDKLAHEAYRDIQVEIRGVKVRELTPARIGSLYRGQQLVLMGHYWGEGTAEVEITGRVSADTRSYRTSFEFPAESALNPELERLWAFATIENLQQRIDYLGGDPDARQAIIDIALEYGLVTDYTSMVVMRDEAYAQYGIERDNAARVARERAARDQRDASGVRNHTVDGEQRAFTGNRAYPQDGAGALGPWSLPLLLLLLVGLGHSRQRQVTA